MPSISIIAPAYNEGANIIFSIQGLINLSYRNKTVIAINDGSTDDTLDIMKRTFKLTQVHRSYTETIPTQPVVAYYHSLIYPNLIVIDKINGGKPDSVNAGINATTPDYILTMDADSLIDSTELNRMLRYSFMLPEVEGFGASVRVANGCTIELHGITKVDMPQSFLGRIQAVEYLRAFYMGRMGFEFLGGPLIISGAFGIYRTSIVRREGGYDNTTLAEDMEMVLKYKKGRYLHHENPRTGFIPEPACWTEIPERWKILGRQRTRWQIGVMQVLWKYRSMLFNPRYGLTGLISYPYFFFGEMLSPLAEVTGYLLIPVSLIFHISTWQFMLFFFSITIGISFLFTISSCLLEVWLFKKYNSFDHLRKMIYYAFIENFGFRQVHLYWRFRAFFKIFKKQSASVKDMEKTGFTGQSLEGVRKEK